ncbi:uncharacterized protein VP01_3832g3 [Puccinia sorghi]|uniref:Uncharacterized protein n=1 Tax=Puccinia sorghi TaxID=27349 RepID=A0A0L6UV30_9BASI|nr:uncharacterized protein VP01_3832g3 [Puccinia sorghi]
MDSSDIQVIASQNQSPLTTNPLHPSQSNQAQKSWFWCHSKLKNKTNKVKCLSADKKKGKPCGVLHSQDLTSSAKSMSEHLKKMHQMVPPNQERTNQLLLPNFIKQCCAEHCACHFSPS